MAAVRRRQGGGRERRWRHAGRPGRPPVAGRRRRDSARRRHHDRHRPPAASRPAGRLSHAARPPRSAHPGDRRAGRLLSARRLLDLGLGDSALCRAFPPQLGHRRPGRSALAGTLGARAAGRHRADQSARRRRADASAGGQSVLPVEPPFPQSALLAHRGSGRGEGHRRHRRAGARGQAPEPRAADRSGPRIRAEVASPRSGVALRPGEHRRRVRDVPARTARPRAVRDVLCPGRAVRGQLASVACRSPAPVVSRSRPRRRRPRLARANPVPPMAAVPGRSAAGARVGGDAGDAGSADRVRRRRRRRLGVPGRARGGHHGRRAARRVQHARAELGIAAVRAGSTPRRRLRAVHPDIRAASGTPASCASIT